MVAADMPDNPIRESTQERTTGEGEHKPEGMRKEEGGVKEDGGKKDTVNGGDGGRGRGGGGKGRKKDGKKTKGYKGEKELLLRLLPLLAPMALPLRRR